jgi:uncharacterized protein YlxW (UPF0749 family)
MIDLTTIYNAVMSEQTLTAAVATLLSSVVLKFAESNPERTSVVEEHLTLYEEHNKLREELRAEMQILRNEIKELKDEVDEWRDKYYSQVETTNELLFEVASLKEKLGQNDEPKDISGE